MANYYASARTNWFRVRSRESFLTWTHTVPEISVQERDGRYALFADTEYGWPSERWNSDAGEGAELDLGTELKAHLATGEVAIFMEVGNEKLRYLNGFAFAIRADGERLSLSLDDIYDLVKREWNIEPTQACY